MSESQNGNVAAPADQPSHRGSLRAASAVLGFTIGLFAGMSETPVIGVLISGALGLISGTLVAWLRPSEKPQREGEAAPKLPLEWTQISAAVIPLCLAAILGGLLGVELRSAPVRRMLWAERLVSMDPETLQKQGKSISSDKRVKLLLLQRSLDKFGVSIGDNNAVVNGFINDLSSASGGKKALETTGEQLVPVRVYMRRSKEAIEMVRDNLESLGDAAREIESVIQQSSISDPDRLKKLRYVRRFLEDLPRKEELTHVAVDGKDIDRMLYQLEQPELDVVLKHVRSFASASPSTESKESTTGFQSRFTFAP